MDSHARRGGHLDATAGREVVYCHACSNEWWKEDHGLQCPRCNSDITEIVSPENDPRLIEDGPSLHVTPGMERRRHQLDDDSDPEEADIDEHLFRNGPAGFFVNRRTWGNQRGDYQRHGSEPPPHTRELAIDPADGDQIIRRFVDMVNELGMGLPRPAEETRGAEFSGVGPFGGSGNVRTYHRTGPGGTTSFTIATGPIHIQQGGVRSPVGPRTDSFQSFFSSVLSGAGPPSPGGPAIAGQGPRATGDAPTLLYEILNMLNPANSAHGDAVYSQEALDRIISTLMEQNPQSNAAPPATEDALRKLERKKVDAKMLGPEGKAECTICIDEFKESDDATVLPCKHWFHDQCVVMWLKEHNTCPICRTPIEEPNNNNIGNASNPNDSNANIAPHRASDTASGPSGSSTNPAGWDGASPGIPPEPWRSPPSFITRAMFFDRPPIPSNSTRPDDHTATDWNERFPLYGATASGRTPDIPARPSPSESSRMSSFRSRRDSHSPPSLRRHQSDNLRARQRSPSSGNWERNQDNNNEDAGSSSGPLHWLRNTFSRGSGAGDNSRERRRS